MSVLNYADQVINAVEQLIGILLGVTSHFPDVNRLAEWMAIFNLVSEGDFQVPNCSWIL